MNKKILEKLLKEKDEKISSLKREGWAKDNELKNFRNNIDRLKENLEQVGSDLKSLETRERIIIKILIGNSTSVSKAEVIRDLFEPDISIYQKRLAQDIQNENFSYCRRRF